MKTTFHFQSMLIGAVFSAVVMAMILPTFGQERNRNQDRDAFDPNFRAQQHQPQEEPQVVVVVESGRYQVATSDRLAYIIDTQTGEVWKDRDFSDRPMSTRGFFDLKLNHEH